MRKKAMIFTTIFTLAICLCCLGVGVWAAISQNFGATHTIGFIADENVFVSINGRIINSEQTSLTEAPDGYNTLDEYFEAKNFVHSQEFSETDRQAGNQSLEDWVVGENLKFTSNDDGITFEITVYNYSDCAITVEITNYVTNNDKIINTVSSKITIAGYKGDNNPSSGVVTLNTKANSTVKFDANNDFTVTIKSAE